MSVFEANAVLHRTKCLADLGQVRGSLFRSEIRLYQPARRVQPGQFFMIRPMAAQGSDPLLPRALSALDYDVGNGILSVCYRVYGKGTEALASLTKGGPLQVYGPHGNGFDLKELTRGRRAVLVGGGVGIPPLYLLAKALRERNRDVVVFQGARSAKELLIEREFKALGVDYHRASDDGSKGFRGVVGELFAQHAEVICADRKPPIVYTCGPHPMMRDVALRAMSFGLECRVSMEERMACATGICLGCVVLLKTPEGEKYVPSCIKGPVYDAKHVVWGFEREQAATWR